MSIGERLNEEAKKREEMTVGDVLNQMTKEHRDFVTFVVAQAMQHNIVALDFCHEFEEMDYVERKVTKFLYQKGWENDGQSGKTSTAAASDSKESGGDQQGTEKSESSAEQSGTADNKGVCKEGGE